MICESNNQVRTDDEAALASTDVMVQPAVDGERAESTAGSRQPTSDNAANATDDRPANPSDVVVSAASEDTHTDVNVVMAEPGQQEEDIREKAHRLCREYLHGSWRRVAAHELIIRKVSGGLSNLLFYCALPESHPPKHGEPAKVLLRLYGQIHGERALEGLITESVIFTLLSESQRGPRLFGVFPGGRLEEYIPARPLLTDELSNPMLSTLIAEKAAQIHLMNVPINKEPRWLWETMERWLGTIQEFMSQRHIPDQFQAMVNKLLNYSLHMEFEWLREFLIAVKSPVVFCHNDLQEGNILLRNDTGIFSEDHEQQTYHGNCEEDDAKLQGNQQLVVIDFEYCSYNYRGFDFANHMCEWLYDYSNEEHPYFWAKPHNYATKEQQERFIRTYLQTIKREMHGDEASYQNSSPTREEVDQLLYEIRTFTLASHFFWGLWSVVNASISKISFDYWAYGEARLEAYFKHKSELLANADSSVHTSITQRFQSL